MADEEVRCTFCERTEAEHYSERWHSFLAAPRAPEPHEVIPALAVTTWTCPHCGLEQDVWGEGAVNGWMDCQSAIGCPASWLSLDLGIAEALGMSTEGVVA